MNNTHPIKILIVSTSLFIPENKDGINKINYHLVKRNDYYQADFLCPQINESMLINKGEFDHVTIHTIKTNRKNKYKLLRKISWFFSLSPYSSINNNLLIKFLEKIKIVSNQYDVIHLSTLAFSPLLKLLPDNIKEKCILCPVDSPTLFYLRRSKNEKKIVKKIIWHVESIKNRFHEKTYYQLAKKVLFVSKVDEEYTRKIHGMNNLKTVTVGVDTDFFNPNPDLETEDQSIIFTGLFDYSPNDAAAKFLALNVLPFVIKRLPDFKLYLVGGSPSKSLLSKNNANIIVTGFVDDIRSYIQKSKLYVSPIFFGTGMKNKILEAMSLHKTVIGSPVSFEGIYPVDQRDCIIVESQSAKHWADTIVSQLKEENRNEEIGKNARKFVEKTFSWDKIRKDYGLVYKEIAEGRKLLDD